MHKNFPNVNKLETFVLTFFINLCKHKAGSYLWTQDEFLDPFAIKYILHIMVENVYEYIYIWIHQNRLHILIKLGYQSILY